MNLDVSCSGRWSGPEATIRAYLDQHPELFGPDRQVRTEGTALGGPGAALRGPHRRPA